MTPADRLHDTDVRLLGEAMISDHGRAFLRDLCDTAGSRFAGSRDEWRAGDWLLAQMRTIGLGRVHAEPFRFLAWERRRRPVLRVTAPRPAAVDCLSLPYCPATRRGGIELDLLDAGPGMPEDFARLRRRIRGRAVMVTSDSPAYYHRWVHRAEKFALAVAAGARAFLFVNQYDGLLPATGCLRFGREAEIPGLALSREEGQRLKRRLDGGPVSLRIETFDRCFRSRSRNVLGEFPGTERPDEMIVVGGHYDGHDISDAAADNGSGVATILEVARLLAPHRGLLKRTVRFVAFGAEEVGLLGGHDYVARHADELHAVRLMVNVDCIGNSRGKGFNFQGWDEAKEPLAAMRTAMHEQETLAFGSRPEAYSDHFNFVVAGVPSCTLGSNVASAPSGRGFGHTAADTLDKVSQADLREAAGILARSLLRFANDPVWALRHKSSAEVKRLLDRYGIRAVLRTEGTLPKALR